MNTCRKAAVCFLAVLLTVLLMSFTCAASENIGEPIELSINNTPVAGARLISGTAYAPYRVLVNAIDPAAAFTWDAANNATVSEGTGVQMTAYADQHYITANNRVLYAEIAKNLILNGTLYVPIRSVACAYTLECAWNGATRSVVLTGNPTPIQNGDEFYDEDVIYWLSRIISAESRGEPFEGQIAVGNVVLNRTESGSFPDTVYGVIFDRKYGTQFTPAATGTIYNDPTDSAVLAAKAALEGVELVDDALFFCANYVSNGSWIEANRSYAETIGNHIFYY